jgi:hypothetical protein
VVEIARRSGNLNWQYEAHLGMGRSHVDLGDGRPALEHHWQAHLLAERLPVRADLARAEDCLGDTYAILGEPAQARQHWQTALALLTEIGVDHTDDPETNREEITTKLRRSGT